MSYLPSVTPESFGSMPFYGYWPLMYTNYGLPGDFQVTAIPYYQANNFQCLFNPIAAASYGMYGISTGNMMFPSPAGMVESGGLFSAEQALNSSYTALKESNINQVPQVLSAMKTKVEAALKREDLSDEDKTKLEDLKTRIETLEKEVKELKEDTSMEPKDAYYKSSEIQVELKKISTEGTDLFKELEAKKKEAEEANKSEDKDKAKETEDADKSEEANKSEDEDKAEETEESSKKKVDKGSEAAADSTQTAAASTKAAADSTRVKPQGASANSYSTQTTEKVDNIYNALYGAGTNVDVLQREILGDAESGEKGITADNVMDVLTGWNMSHSAEEGESLMDALSADLLDWGTFSTFRDKGRYQKYCKRITAALKQKAIELGIYDKEMAKEFGAIEKKLNSEIVHIPVLSWIAPDIEVTDEVNAIVKKIAAAMGGKYVENAEAIK